MTPDQTWMWHWGGMWVFPMLMVMIIFFFILFGRGCCRPQWRCPKKDHREGEERDSALEILKKRYAKGEIKKEEFQQIKKDILEAVKKSV
jgi:putative membrane protein